MALEDRVEALEEELKVLKNQVHATLLEIQEQILMHYYPSLRGDVAPPPGTAWKAQRTSKDNGSPTRVEQESPLPQEDLRRIFSPDVDPSDEDGAHLPVPDTTLANAAPHQPPQREKAAVSPTHQASPDCPEVEIADADDFSEDPVDLPDMRQISYDELREVLAEKPTAEPPTSPSRDTSQPKPLRPSVAGAAEITDPKESHSPASGQSPPLHPDSGPSAPAEAFVRPQGELTVRAHGGISWTGFGDLMAWVSESVEKIGAESTRTATEVYARAGYLDVGLQGIIFQLISQHPTQAAEREATTGEIVSALKGLNRVLVRASGDSGHVDPFEETSLG